MKRIFIALVAVLAVLLPALNTGVISPASASPEVRPGMIPCGQTATPFSMYALPIYRPETLTLDFHASGQGIISFTAATGGPFYSVSTDASCHNCELVLSNVRRGPSGRLDLNAIGTAAPCPSRGLVINHITLRIAPFN